MPRASARPLCGRPCASAPLAFTAPLAARAHARAAACAAHGSATGMRACLALCCLPVTLASWLRRTLASPRCDLSAQLSSRGAGAPPRPKLAARSLRQPPPAALRPRRQAARGRARAQSVRGKETRSICATMYRARARPAPAPPSARAMHSRCFRRGTWAAVVACMRAGGCGGRMQCVWTCCRARGAPPAHARRVRGTRLTDWEGAGACAHAGGGACRGGTHARGGRRGAGLSM
ncbi:MAG: hypothetical protein J3K34DRAFT_399974 [Monoraphidium minutum]|nr:MAG: hypothetical protein J3K34DRAFT_399974 [Monoraphidium minutum]